MRPILAFLVSAPAVIALVTLVLSVCAWFFSPYIGSDSLRPFDGVAARLLLIGGMWVCAGLAILALVLLRRARARRIETDIVAGAGDEEGAVTAELAELRTKLRGALAALRRTRGGRRSLYELPWYVMIGPPGAGKTTAIVNSGLKFPLAEEMGKTAFGGVGGTRNCDWWFTDSAVLIDTAGRYTTQDSDAEADNAAWTGFLSLLKRHRTRQPINGAMIAISLSDLSLQDEQTQMGHARAVRRRLHELRERLGVRFPVYVLFTKADLIAGFSEVFETLGKEEREQVWGFTLPLAAAAAEPVAAFGPEFDALLARLNAQTLERMQAETDPQRRSLIAGFPSQVASFGGVAQAFLAEVFQENRFEKGHSLRGVYFTSGTQEGTPIDRLMMGMARTFGIGRQAIGSGRGSGRSYFLTGLFLGVIFPEAGLVSADDRVERRYRWSRRAAVAATVLAALGAGALWARSYTGNQALLARVGADVAAYEGAAKAIRGNPIGDTDLPAILPALNILRDTPVNPIPARIDPARPDPFAPETRLTWGLYQGDVIANQAGQSYRAALNRHFLPRLLLQLEERIQASMATPDPLYEALRIYLMLGSRGEINPDMVRDWMAVEWQRAFPAPSQDALRADLAFHLEALLNQPMTPIALNGPLIEQAQAVLSEMPLAQRVYNGIVNSAAATALPDWRPVDAGGPALGRAMIRSSGRPFTEGIDGIFTRRGFEEVFLAEALGVAERIQRDSWVLGPSGAAEQTEAALAALSRDVLGLYYSDYIAAWDAMLADLDILPLQSLGQAVEVTNVLSGTSSPIRYLLEAVAEETRLTEPLPQAQVEEGALGDALAAGTAVAAVGVQVAQRNVGADNRRLLAALQGVAGGGGAPVVPGAPVEARFDWLHRLVARPEGQPSELDALLVALTAVYQELNRMSFQPEADGAIGGEALLAFQQAAGRVEGPLQRWSAQIATGSSGITAEGNRAGLNARWQAQVLPFCEQVTTGRYPFDRRAAADVGMQDFVRLFGPGGMIDSFFAENLADLVDMRTRPWSWRTVNGADLGISPAVLAQFQAAAEIREAFFPAGPAPAVSFQITPIALDENAEVVSLEIDGQKIDFSLGGGQALPTAITWPGAVGLARVGFGPPLAEAENIVRHDGPWGWFRLLDGAQRRDTAVADRTRIIFSIGGRIAIFELQSGSVINPFSLAALSGFRCPTSF